MVAVMKITNSCNMACRYCYMQPFRGSRIMSDEVVDAIVRRLQAEYDTVQYCWHGGEPTIAGKDFLTRVVSIQRRYERPGLRICNLMQSNGTLLTEDFLGLARDLQFAVSISFDGTEEAHNANRRFADGSPSFAQVVRGIRNAIKVMGKVRVLVVVNRANVGTPEAVFRTLMELGVSSVAFLPYCNSPRNDEFAIQPGELFSFWQEFMKLVFSEGRSFEKVTPMFEYISGIFGQDPGACFCYKDCLSCALGFDVCGDVYLCDLSLPEHRLGNVLDAETLGAILGSVKARRIFQEVATFLESFCGSCEWFPICGGGCRISALAEHGTYAAPDPHCHAMKSIIEWLYRELQTYCSPSAGEGQEARAFACDTGSRGLPLATGSGASRD